MKIEVTNLVSHRDQRGIVQIACEGKPLGQMDVQTARQLAQQIEECAAIAECEAMLVAFLTTRLNLSIEQACAVLADFRQQRG